MHRVSKNIVFAGLLFLLLIAGVAVGLILGKWFFWGIQSSPYIEAINALGTLLAAIGTISAVCVSMNIAHEQNRIARIDSKEEVTERFRKFLGEFLEKGRFLDGASVEKYAHECHKKAKRHFPEVVYELEYFIKLVREFVKHGEACGRGEAEGVFSEVGEIRKTGEFLLEHMENKLSELEVEL